MKNVMFAALALIVSVESARSEEKCLIEPTQSPSEATCLSIKLPPSVAPVVVTTISVDPARVAAMPPLLQPDTVVKEVSEQ
jgi:hypothetical protein